MFLAACIAFGPPPLAHMSLRDLVPFGGVAWGMLAMPLMLALIGAWRRFYRMDRSAQWVVAGVVLLIDALLVILVFATMH